MEIINVLDKSQELGTTAMCPTLCLVICLASTGPALAAASAACFVA